MFNQKHHHHHHRRLHRHHDKERHASLDGFHLIDVPTIDIPAPVDRLFHIHSIEKTHEDSAGSLTTRRHMHKQEAIDDATTPVNGGSEDRFFPENEVVEPSKPYSVNDFIDQVENNYKGVLNDIDRTFSKLIDLLQVRRERLAKQARSVFQRKISALKEIQKDEAENTQHDNSFLYDEGNMEFTVQSSLDIFHKIRVLGEITSALSSPQTSRLSATTCRALEREAVKTFVETKGLNGQANVSEKDALKFKVINNNGVVIEEGETDPNSEIEFTPKMPGMYKLHAYLNGVEINNSPLEITTYVKEVLTFDGCNGSLEENNTASEEKNSDGEDSSHSGDVTRLLHNTYNVPSTVYTSAQLSGEKRAWKYKLTSACTDITVTLGVATRYGIHDIEEQFSFTRRLNKEKQTTPTHGNRRRASSFSTSTFHYTLFYDHHSLWLDDTKTCQRLAIEKRAYSNLALYPFVSIVHHHDCIKGVCPRPHLTLL